MAYVTDLGKESKLALEGLAEKDIQAAISKLCKQH